MPCTANFWRPRGPANNRERRRAAGRRVAGVYKTPGAAPRMHRDAPVRYHHVADADPGETRGPLAGGSFLAEFVDSRRHGGYAAMRFAPDALNLYADSRLVGRV